MNIEHKTSRRVYSLAAAIGFAIASMAALASASTPAQSTPAPAVSQVESPETDPLAMRPTASTTSSKAKKSGTTETESRTLTKPTRSTPLRQKRSTLPAPKPEMVSTISSRAIGNSGDGVADADDAVEGSTNGQFSHLAKTGSDILSDPVLLGSGGTQEPVGPSILSSSGNGAGRPR